MLAVLGFGVVSVLMASWASANKYSLLGGLRAAAQLLAYELPFVLAAASVAMAAGTLSLTGIVEAWQPWWLLWQLPAMFVFFVAGLAEIRRPPFDMPIADSELVFGYLTEYTGLRFAFFLLAEYVGIVVIAALTTVLFLGGWKGPFGLDAELGWLWTLIKIFAVSFVVIWLRVAYPRLREDQLQRLCWLGLVPLALLQLILTAASRWPSVFGQRNLESDGEPHEVETRTEGGVEANASGASWRVGGPDRRTPVRRPEADDRRRAQPARTRTDRRPRAQTCWTMTAPL